LSPPDSELPRQTARGLFVAVDGPDGVGKTTTISILARQLADHDLPVHSTTEPSRTPLGDFIRRAQETYRGLALACLVAADRYHHVATAIRPRVAAGLLILCDRYVASSLVLQRMDGVDLDFVWQLNRHAPSPDLTVILLAEPAELARRLGDRGTHSRFERQADSAAIQSRLYREAVDWLAASGSRVLTIDSTATPPEQVARTILASVLALLEEEPT
jgi:dTMP kinase